MYHQDTCLGEVIFFALHVLFSVLAFPQTSKGVRNKLESYSMGIFSASYPSLYFSNSFLKKP